ncbi:GAK10 protein, partial [Vireo altiloquus]|nr:GAK10 protein [Vireo altiloquus]NWT13957.1 GAK10 protein [Vireo altiloquus]
IDMQEAADAVLKSLAYENANDCKKALDSIRSYADIELSDYIKTCTNISSEPFKAELIATTIAQQLQVARAAVKCFECTGVGHFRKQCLKEQRSNKRPCKPCSRCQKGFHWSNQCRSKYDKHSNLFPQQGNSKGSTQGSGVPQFNRTPLNMTPI